MLGSADDAFYERVGVGYVINGFVRKQSLGPNELHLLGTLPDITMTVIGGCVDHLDSIRGK